MSFEKSKFLLKSTRAHLIAFGIELHCVTAGPAVSRVCVDDPSVAKSSL